MALQAAYKQFLAAPNPAFLANNASLHYITTLVTINGAPEILKHLNVQSLDLKKNEEVIIDVVEGHDAIAAEVHTTLEFLTSGGAYLPKLDDNFLADRVVTFPVIHIVHFDESGKITQIRQSWDQGSLLKLIDVIGKTGRNWPIRDGKDQINLIKNSVKSAGRAPTSDDDGAHKRSRENSNNVTRDPHASLELFAPRERKTETEALPSVVPPRASSKPPPRDYHDLFVGNESDHSPITQAKEKTQIRDSFASPKGGAGKNYAPSRLFDLEGDHHARESPSKIANPKKFQHFAFADGSDEQDSEPAPRPNPLRQVSNKHGSNWNFDDFNTPAKVVPTKALRNNDVRHWGNSDDEVVDSPIKAAKADKPRRDAETHFDFVDDGTPEADKRHGARPRGAGGNNGQGLYKNNIYDDEQGGEAGGDAPGVKSIANTNDRRKDFDPQFAYSDDSPVSKTAPRHVDDNKAKAIKMMNAQWSAYDQSPNQKENLPLSPSASKPIKSGPLSETTNRPIRDDGVSGGINIAGDGMGSRKVADGADTIKHKTINIAGDGMGSRKVAEAPATTKQKGINIGGDGMGGKKGSGRQWGFGDESDGEEQEAASKPKYRTGKTQGRAQETGGDFWDF